MNYDLHLQRKKKDQELQDRQNSIAREQRDPEDNDEDWEDSDLDEEEDDVDKK